MSMTVSSWDSSSISTLFSSISSSSSSSTTDLSSLTSSLSDYNLIRSGSYYKLMKSYYAGTASDETSSLVSDSSSTKSNLQQTVTSAASLDDSVDTLLKSSLYNKTTSTDEDGNTTSDYDKDAIYKAVKSYVNSYNDLVDAGGDSETTGVLSSVSSMVNYSKVNSNLLSSVGISINSDNTLEIDEDYFKNSADMSTVKSLFGTSGGYAYQVQAMANAAKTYANSDLSTTYSSSGSYNTNYSSTYNSYV